MRKAAFLSIFELAEMIGCHHTTIRRATKSGTLPAGFPPAVSFGNGKAFFRVTDVEEFLSSTTKRVA